jgi:hypothetical protein
MKTKPKPAAPQRCEPKNWTHYDLWQRVREALLAIPSYFRTPTNIEGMLATDIFTLNAALGATIEEQVVQTLNAMRPFWDPKKEYQAYSFVRQPQTFPDVLLRKRTNGQEVLMGIELKGWYLLAKEGMPNFRFVVSRDACAQADLLVVIPWVLSNVLAGSPIVFPSFIELARFAAEKRNYYWQYEREAKGDSGLVLASGVAPCPAKSDKIADRAVSDDGNNFGRCARYGILDAYMQEMTETKIRGITAKEWLAFFKRHAKDTGE